MILTNSLAILAMVGVVSALGLQEPAGSKQATPGAKASPTLPGEFFLTKEPEGAKAVEDVKKSAKPGDKVAIRGRIGGSASPFVEGRAVFTLMGPGLKACSDNPEDKCQTPWDYCCETPKAIAKHSATIQVVDAAGSPLRVGLKATNGLRELSEIVVLGTVKDAKENILIINATGLHVVPSKSPALKKDGQ